MFADLSPPYRTIVADPPWIYDEGFVQWHTAAGRKDRDLPYSSMTLDDICALPVWTLADKDCWLFLWTTNKYLLHTSGVLLDWGFEYRQTLVWHKTGNPSPFGGSVAPNHAEYLIAAARGNPKLQGRLDSNIIAANKKSGGGRHSQKPPAVLDAVEQVAEGPYVELFARQPRIGWDSWGCGFEEVGVGAADEARE